MNMLPMVLLFSPKWKGFHSLPSLSEFNDSNIISIITIMIAIVTVGCYYRYCYYIMKMTFFILIVLFFPSVIIMIVLRFPPFLLSLSHLLV